MEDVATEIVEDIAESEGALPKRKRGRPEGAKTQKPVRKPSGVIATRYRNYYTGHHNKAQDTRASWAWLDGLDEAEQGIIDLTVYRDWPVLKMPLKPADGTKRKNPKSIAEQIPGTKAFKTDQDVVDMFGAGDYRVYINVNPEGQARRELFCNVVKATHDFRAFPPSDWRIDDINNVDLSDPSNGSYVAFLKSQGKIPDDAKDAKEKDEMSATAEVLGKVLDQSTAVMNRMLDEKDKQIATSESVIPPEPPPSPQEVISEQLSIFKSLKELVPTSDPLEMVKQVIGMAQVLTSKDGSADLKPLQDEISKLREESRATEREMWRVQFAELKEQIRVAKETPTQPNVLLPDGSNIKAVIDSAIAKALDAGLPEDTAWYVEPLKQLVPVAIPALGILLQRLMAPAPPPAPFPMPPANFQAGQPQPAQPQQLPAPQPQPQPSGEENEINRILTNISAPVIEALANEDSGEQFADWVREEFGASSQRLLAKFSEQEIAGALMMFPLTAPRMTQFKQEQVAKFVSEFKNYDRDKYDLKIEALELSK